MTTDVITPDEYDLLRFHARPAVLRFGTPVCSNNPERTYKGQAVILSVDPGRNEARVAYAHGLVYPNEWVDLDDIALDLTDATGRAHLAWWIGGVGASLHMACDGHRRWELHGGERPRESVSRAWEGIGAESRRLRGSPPMYGWDADDMPALDTLDPDDPRLLPDGSRLVDALALSLIARHVAGLEVTR